MSNCKCQFTPFACKWGLGLGTNVQRQLLLGGGEIYPDFGLFVGNARFHTPRGRDQPLLRRKFIVWTAFIDSFTRRRRLPTENGGAAAALKKEGRREERRGSSMSQSIHVLPPSAFFAPLFTVDAQVQRRGGRGRGRAAASLRSGGGLRRRKERIGLRRRRRRSIKHKALQKSGTYYYCSLVRSPPQCLAGGDGDW